MTSLCWIPPLHLYSVGFVRTNTSPMLFWRYPMAYSRQWEPHHPHHYEPHRGVPIQQNHDCDGRHLPCWSEGQTSEMTPVHTTSKDAVHLPLGKCNVKSDKIQTFHDFREKHNVSKTRTNLNQRAMQISSSNSQNANLNETWTIIPHLSNEKHLNHVWRCNSPFSSLFQRPNQLSKPLLSYG